MFILMTVHQVHRGQGCVSEVLREDAGQEARAPEQCERRRRGEHDLQAEGKDRLLPESVASGTEAPGPPGCRPG